MYKSVPPEDYTTCGSAVWLRSTLMTFWFPVVNTFSRNTPIMSDVNAVSIFQDSTLPPSDSSHSVNNSPTSWKPRIALLSNITYPIFNIKIDDFACLMVTRICKWHWGSCKTCNFTWMLLGTVAWSLSSLSMLPSICFAKAAWCCLHAKYNMGHIIWLFDNKSEQFCMLPSMIQNISFNTFLSDGGWRRQNSFQNFIAGGCGGVSATLVGHPFDTIKVMTQ